MPEQPKEIPREEHLSKPPETERKGADTDAEPRSVGPEVPLPPRPVELRPGPVRPARTTEVETPAPPLESVMSGVSLEAHKRVIEAAGLQSGIIDPGSVEEALTELFRKSKTEQK